MKRNGTKSDAAAWHLLAVFVLCVSCGSAPPPKVEAPQQGTAAPVAGTTANGAASETPSVSQEIRALTNSGIPSNLLRSLDLIRSRELTETDFGRVMIAIDVAFIKTIYPDVQAQLPQPDLPPNHAYSRILRDAQSGIYSPPFSASTDYLEYVIPFLALWNESGDRLQSALPDLQKAMNLDDQSVLAPLFLGVVYERTGRLNEATAAYNRTYNFSRECYPAALGLARVMLRQGQSGEALRLLSDLVIRYPDYLSIKRQLAITYYENGDWSRADPAIAEILQKNPRDGEFILMRARVLVEQGQFLQAQAPLDQYAAINPENRLYLFLRARVQAEGFRNRDAALNYLRSLLRTSPQDDEASVYAARLLLESPRKEDQTEGRQLLERFLAAPDPAMPVLELALHDAMTRQDWKAAQRYVNRLLDSRRSPKDLLDASTVEKNLGNSAKALAYAKELYERDAANEEGLLAYIGALIDTGRADEAAKMIDGRINQAPSGTVKSRYYYLRSRVRSGEDSIMNELRSSLFEDPRNLQSIIAMFEIYHRRRDGRRAVYYLKQALALDPNNPTLKRYETEYKDLLN